MPGWRNWIYATDSKSVGRKAVRVRVPPQAQSISKIKKSFEKAKRTLAFLRFRHMMMTMPKAKIPAGNYPWTPELAYVVGLLATDGNLSGDGRHVTMRSAELEMIETFQKCLDDHHKLGTEIKPNGSISYRMQVCGVAFYRWLLTIGLFPAKSYTIGPLAIPDEFFRDFFRGCIDGDGSIRVYKDTYNEYRGRKYENQRLYVHLVSASPIFIDWIQDTVSALTNIHGVVVNVPPRSEKHVPLYLLKYAKAESLKIIDWIYYSPDVPCLQRKRKRAEDTAAIIRNQKRKTYSLISG